MLVSIVGWLVAMWYPVLMIGHSDCCVLVTINLWRCYQYLLQKRWKCVRLELSFRDVLVLCIGSWCTSPVRFYLSDNWYAAPTTIQKYLFILRASSMILIYHRHYILYNFQQWMSWLPYWWRMQRNAIHIVNCKTSWIIKILNVYHTSGKCPGVCLFECP